jgi:DNA-binding NarL/FixJ family response regulator
VERKPRILVVDDTPRNIKVLDAMLAPRGYAVVTASSGAEALLKVAAEPPDLVLTDVIMPNMDGYELCRRLRADSATRLLPVVMVTASGDREKVSALEAGADDFVQKPFNQAELLARVASLLRIKTYQDTIQEQATELAELNRNLEARVQGQVSELERLGRLRRFLAPQVAELLVSADGEALLESHRRQIAVVCCQLPGFAAFADATAPEEVLTVLRAYHEGLGSVIYGFEGTVGPLVADRLTVLFNDPLPIDDPAGQAVRLAVAMRARMTTLMAGWRKTGYTLDFTVGIDLGYATLGTIGFAGKTEYGAIGTVVHLAARLAEIAQSSQILISQRVQLATEELVESSALGEQAVAGLVRPVPVFLVERLRVAGTSATISGADRLATSGPLTEREREVVGLIVRGCTNREIAEKLVIAEGTAVRHVANILNKLDLHSRAQVAVWAIQQERPVA